MREEFIEKIYAGWLAKIVGIRLGAPVEGWTYDRIRNIFGEVTDYLVDYHEFAADDDSNGPIFLVGRLWGRDRAYGLFKFEKWNSRAQKRKHLTEWRDDG